jgi:hypothetical protein
MTAASVLARGRAAAERLMVDECTITRAGEGEPVFNETTMQYDPPPGSTVYTGRCRVQLTGAMAGTPEAAERVLVVQRATVQVPISVTGVEVDDVVTITASAHDPDLVGNRYRVRSLFAKTHATARRLEVEETQT